MWSNENLFFIQVEIGNNFINRSMIQTSSSELSAITSVTWSSGNLVCAAQTATIAGPNLINIKSCANTQREAGSLLTGTPGFHLLDVFG